MSYKIVCYCKDEAIWKTKFEVKQLGISETGTFGDSSLGEWEEISASGIPDGYPAEFTVTPEYSPCRVTWTYHLGSPTAETQYFYSDDIYSGTFVYDGTGGDIYISAVGDRYVLESHDLGELTKEKPIYRFLDGNTVLKYAMTFANSGTAKFNPYQQNFYQPFTLFISTSAVFNNIIGAPDGDYVEGGSDWGEDNITEYEVEAGETYYIYLKSWERYVNTEALDLTIIPPQADNPYVEKWSWSTSNGEATSDQTANAYDAVYDNGGNIRDFHYLVWNDMVDKVFEIITALGGEWLNNYDTRENTKMTATDKVLTSERFNSMRFNIGSRYSTGINEEDADKGKEVKGEYFLTLAECINNWIDRDLW